MVVSSSGHMDLSFQKLMLRLSELKRHGLLRRYTPRNDLPKTFFLKKLHLKLGRVS